MARMRVFCLFAIVVGIAADATNKAEPRPDLKEWEAEQANITADKDAELAKQAKMAAVDKVITMLEDLQLQVLAEGEKEAATYNKFACFCKTTQKDKTEAIKTGKDDKASLSADIKKLSKERDDLDDKISKLNKDIKKAQDAMAFAKSKSDDELKVYQANEADMKA